MFRICKDRKILCNIAFGVQPDEHVTHAAKTLQKIIKKATGKTIPATCVTDVSPGRDVILIGQPHRNELIKRLLGQSGVRLTRQGRIAQLATMKNGDQGFVIRFVKDGSRQCVVLAGNTERGAFYAVQTFGDCLYKTTDGTFAVDRKNVLTAPAFEHRSFFSFLGAPNCYLSGKAFEESFSRKDGGIDTEAFIDWVARYRVNNLILGTLDLNFGIGYRSKKFPKMVNKYHTNVRHEFFSDLIKTAHCNHISVYLYAEFPDRCLGILHHMPELALDNRPDNVRNNLKEQWWRWFYEGRLFADFRNWLVKHEGGLDVDKPATMRFWKAYWRDVLSTYPELDGIGCEFCEHMELHPRRQDFQQQIWNYLKAMVDVAEQVRPGLDYWVYHKASTVEIARRRRQLPNLTYIPWGSSCIREPSARVNGARPDWYLTHGNDSPNYEPWIKRHCLACRRIGYKGIQKRLAKYHECDRSYFALSQFAWSPKMGWNEFAERYVLRTYRLKDSRRSRAYADDLRKRAAQALLEVKRHKND